jgi:G:T/U-mismatch repair DNA glycosylase
MVMGLQTSLSGLQEQKIGNTSIWVLPNPSGLNAHHRLPDLIKYFAELRLRTMAVYNPGCL